MTHQAAAKPKSNRLISLSWAELGIRFRNAILKGDQPNAARAKQAIALKKEVRKSRKAR